MKAKLPRLLPSWPKCRYVYTHEREREREREREEREYEGKVAEAAALMAEV